MNSLFSLVITTLMPIAVAYGDDVAQPSRRLRVGVIAPLTGGVATWGLSVRSAIELANNDSKYPADLFFEDEGTCAPTKALSAFKYLQSEKKVDVIVASCLEGAQAIAPLARRSHIPVFYIWTFFARVSGKESKRTVVALASQL